MRPIPLWLPPLLALPLLMLGAFLWWDQGARVRLADFIASCF